MSAARDAFISRNLPSFSAPASVDLGRTLTNVPIRGALEILNEGKGTLDVSIENVSCGCTKASLSHTTLSSNQRGRLDVEIDPRNDEGPFSITIYMATNDPRRSRVPIVFTGSTYHPLAVSPSIVNFGHVTSITGGQHQRIQIQPRHDISLDSLKSLTVNAAHGYFMAEIEPQDNYFEVIVSLSPTAPVGPLRSFMKLQAPDLRKFSIDIPIFVQVSGRIEVIPETFYFGEIRPHSITERTVELQSLSPDDRLDAIHVDKRIRDKVQVVWERDENECRLIATLTASEAVGRIEGDILASIVNTNADSNLDILIPVVASVQRDR